MIARLRYTDKEQAIQHLISLGVINEDLTLTDITHSVVWLGVLIDSYGEYDEDGEVITPPTYLEGYHLDIMTKEFIDIQEHLVNPSVPKHFYYGKSH